MISHHQVVNGLLLTSGRVLLARRSVDRRIYPDCWSFPGGHIEAGESLEQALVRELEEELGVTPGRFRLLREIEDTPDPTTKYTFHMFVVTEWVGQPTIRDNEHSALKWLPIGEASRLGGFALDQYVPLLRSLDVGDDPEI
ncbi:MAG: NUDIX domain-containing protein [Rhizobiaceae bacterium]